MYKNKRFLIALAIMAAAPLLMLLWFVLVEVRFANFSIEPSFYQGCKKVWAHRGYVQSGLERNSLKSVTRAFDEGAAGVEIDIFYDVEINDYVVSHNRPYKKSEGQTLLLESILVAQGERGLFWLDLKNLPELKPAELTSAVARLEEIGNKQKLIIESPEADALAMFAAKGFYTSYWLMPGENHNHPLVFRLMMTNYKMNLLAYDFSAISMSHLDIGEKVIDELSGLPWHLFVINEKDEMERFSSMENVRVILTDNNQFDFACQQVEAEKSD